MPDQGRRVAAKRTDSGAALRERERRSNVDRSASTRRQIFEATIRCLQTDGYGAVTNIRVAEAAGVSRGAMMHHFPTQQALIVATIEYAYGKLSDYRMQVLSRLDVGLPRYRALIDLAWATAQMPEGRLYEVDMRLRPSGRAGPVATSLASFTAYQENEAWTWEHLALTRARVLAGEPTLAAEVEAFRRALLPRKGRGARVRAEARRDFCHHEVVERRPGVRHGPSGL